MFDMSRVLHGCIKGFSKKMSLCSNVVGKLQNGPIDAWILLYCRVVAARDKSNFRQPYGTFSVASKLHNNNKITNRQQGFLTTLWQRGTDTAKML